MTNIILNLKKKCIKYFKMFKYLQTNNLLIKMMKIICFFTVLTSIHIRDIVSGSQLFLDSFSI